MLTDKQERFCKEYIIDCNAAQAYKRTGYKSEGSAGRLMANPAIRERIAELMAHKDAALIADANEVLQTLTSVMRREQQEQVVVTLTDKHPTLCDDGKVRTGSNQRTELVQVKPRLVDVNRAAELLGRRYGLYSDNVSISMATPVIIDNVPQPKEGDHGQ